YYLLVQIAICDFVMLFTETFYRMAGIVFRQAYLGSAFSTFNYMFHFFQQCAWWTFVWALTITAFNRFVCIVLAGQYSVFHLRILIVKVFCHSSLMGIGMSIPGLTPCCRVRFANGP
ncbi:hypothetical protein PMAYCL1PPCAC_20287, partial [Pristionchus mayeri]